MGRINNDQVTYIRDGEMTAAGDVSTRICRGKEKDKEDWKTLDRNSCERRWR